VDGPCFRLGSISGAAFLASWRAVSARIFAPITLPPHMTSRVLVLIANDYSVIQASEQSTIPSGITRLQRSNLVKRSAEVAQR
jgi:hypothetical protein